MFRAQKLCLVCQHLRKVNNKFPARIKTNLIELKPTSISVLRYSTEKPFVYDLDSDKSWEADYIRKEKKHLEQIEQGVETDNKVSIYESEKINNLPHVIFEETEYSKETKKNEKNKKKNIKQTSKKINIDPDFERPEVYAILQSITGFMVEKIFQPKIEKRKTMPRLRYLTDKELKMEIERYKERAKEKLIMTPVFLPQEPIDCVIQNDPEIEGHDTSPIVFTDVSEDLNDRERYVLVREPNGLLRKASWSEREKIIQVYFPKPNRKIIMPSVFEPEYLKIALQNNLHMNVMERAEIQFDLDSPMYIQVMRTVYDHIDKNNLFHDIRSTKYFGGLAFYLAKYKSIDNLLIDMLQRNLLDHAISLVELYTLLHPDSKTAKQIKNKNAQLIRTYITCDCVNGKGVEQELNKTIKKHREKNVQKN